jgi:hypothetical protein
MAQHRSATPDPIFRPPQDQRHTRNQRYNRQVSAAPAKSARQYVATIGEIKEPHSAVH